MLTNVCLHLLILLSFLLASLWTGPAFGAVAGSRPSPQPTAYVKQKVLGVRTHMVIVDLNDSSMAVSVELARKGIRTSEPFGSMVSRTRPVAAITGTFFCTKSLVPVGDIVVDGKRVHRGPIGACLGVTPDNKVKISPAYKGMNADWAGCDAGIRSGPRLISEGRICINARKEGFRERSLFGRRVRAAIGVTAHNKLLLVIVKTPVTFSELAKVMRALGAVEAMNLDGGSSVALSYQNKIVVRPGRRLTNLIVINKRKPMAPIAASGVVVAAIKPALPVVPISIPRLTTNTAPTPAEPPTVSAVLPEQHVVLPEKVTGKIVE
ncbi:MAG: phosphodiester glycosidase family protein [Armatimonadota bacterium]|nr:phosphodiester glycosidase family protein [Armatimonadota bacterium]